MSVERKITVRIEVELPSEAEFVKDKIEALVAEYQKTRGHDFVVTGPTQSRKSIKDIRNPGFLVEEQ